MDKQIINWLLEGPAWIQYAVETQLLGNQSDPRMILRDDAIAAIVERLKDKRRGLPSMGRGDLSSYLSSDGYENPYWDLFFLADLGLTASDLNLEPEIESFLNTQSSDGTFMTEPSMQPNYLCKSAIMVYNAARLGYRDDLRVKKFVQRCLKSQRLDGGWYCNPNHDIGAPLQDDPSCPQENLNILLLLAQYPENRTNPRFNGAIDLLLNHWELRNTGIQIVYFGVGKRYQSLLYPATRYGILRVLDAVSLYPYSFKKANFHSMLEFVHKKTVDGRYSVEAPSPYTSLEPANQPNRLLTFIVNRIDKRVSDAKTGQ